MIFSGLRVAVSCAVAARTPSRPKPRKRGILESSCLRSIIPSPEKSLQDGDESTPERLLGKLVSTSLTHRIVRWRSRLARPLCRKQVFEDDSRQRGDLVSRP